MMILFNNDIIIDNITKMNILTRITQSLTMKYQALILQGIISVFVIIGIYLIQSSLQQKTVDLVSQSSHNVLIKHNNALINVITLSISNFLNQAFNQVYQSLNKTQELYTNDLDFQSLEDIYYCPLSITSQSLKLGKPLSHCLVSDLENVNRSSQYYNNYKNMIKQFDQFLISFQLQNILASHTTFRIQQPHLVTVYKQVPLLPGYNVESRPFWKEYFNQSQFRYIPFFNLATQKCQIMVLQKIFDSNKGELLVGVAINFDLFSQYFHQLPNTMLILCTLKGVIIASNIKNSDSIETENKLTTLFNQSFIFLSQDDWLEINNYIFNRKYTSNCVQDIGEFCRILNNTDIQIEAKLIQEKLILIVFNDLTFTKNERNIVINNQQIMIDNTNQLQIFCIIACFPFIFISLFSFHTILHPISKMVNNLNIFMKTEFKNVENNSNFNNLQWRSDLFKNLKNSINQLIYRHIRYRFIKINQTNTFQYPKKMELLNKIPLTTLLKNIKQSSFYDQHQRKHFQIEINNQFNYQAILRTLNKVI
ncbi:hypothetical protein pb186bvf_007558 [Paramecium bursaria]